jgi:hypothetical protein
MPVPDFSPGEVLTAAAMDSIGLWRVGGGALSTATTNFAGVFTSNYTDYRIVIDSLSVSSTADLYWRMLDGTTPASAANYSWGYYGITENNVGLNSAGAGQGQAFTGFTSNLASNVLGSVSMDIYGPQLPQRTFSTVQAVGYSSAFFSRTGFSHHNLLTAYNGIQFYTASAATITGNVSIYGYRKA